MTSSTDVSHAHPVNGCLSTSTHMACTDKSLTMDIENIDVRRLQLLETRFNRQMKRLMAVTCVVELDWDVVPTHVVGRVLGGNDELIADAMHFCPFAYEFLGASILVHIRSVDEVAL